MFPAKIPIISSPPSAGFTNTYSLQFDGTDDSVDLNITGDELGVKAEGSISVWVYKSELSGNQTIITDRGSGDFLQIAVYDESEPSGDYTFTVSWEGGANQLAYDNAWDVWNHFVITWNADPQRVLYVNGAASVTNTASYDWDANEDLRLGRYAASSNFYTGLIDEVAIWDVALTAADVSSIYNSRVPNDLTAVASYDTDRTGNLKGYWRFEEGSGTSATDSVGVNTGTLNGAPAFSTSVPS